jgi:hypothetical protein
VCASANCSVGTRQSTIVTMVYQPDLHTLKTFSRND